MANAMFWDTQSRLREIKMVHLKVAIGASGAPTIDADASLGVASISRTSAGLYRITLADKYTSLIDMQVSHLGSSIQDLTKQIKAETVNSTKLIDLWTLTGATATDPASGTILYATILLKNSSV
jgi:hypothetical protein